MWAPKPLLRPCRIFRKHTHRPDRLESRPAGRSLAVAGLRHSIAASVGWPAPDPAGPDAGSTVA